MSQLFRWLDLPPVWLIVMIAGVFGLDQLVPGLGFDWGWTRVLGDLMIALGLGTIGGAAWAFLRAQSSIIPRRVPSALLTSGVFRFSRNPIYLGDALILSGLVLRWDVLPALIVVPVFAGLITRRFIRGEEAMLSEQFGDAFDRWAAKVRRWI